MLTPRYGSFFREDIYFSGRSAWADRRECDLYVVAFGDLVSRGGFPQTEFGDDWNILWIEAGEGTVGTKNETVSPLRAGDVFVMRPGVRYRLEDTPEHPWRIRRLTLRGARVREALELAEFLPGAAVRRPGQAIRLAPFFAEIRRMLSGVSINALEAGALAHSCLAACLSSENRPTPDLMQTVDETFPYGSDPEGHESGLTKIVGSPVGILAEEWLRRHYARGVTVNDAADAVGMTRSGLFRAFRLHTGKSPKTYLDDLRIEHARRLLGHGGYRMKEIAARCGFHDARHFYRAFLRKTGSSPLASRAVRRKSCVINWNPGATLSGMRTS